jgi:hypothetical protein
MRLQLTAYSRRRSNTGYLQYQYLHPNLIGLLWRVGEFVPQVHRMGHSTAITTITSPLPTHEDECSHINIAFLGKQT